MTWAAHRAARSAPRAPAPASNQADIAGALRLIEQSGCPLCRARDEADAQAIAWLWVEGYNDFAWRERLAASLGMCRAHWWQAMASERSHAFGASCVGEAFTQAALRDLARREQTLRKVNTPRAGARAHIRQWWTWLRPHRGLGVNVRSQPAQPCPLCEGAALDERVALRRLYQALATGGGWARYQRSDGFCLPHLRRALSDAPDEAARGVALALVVDMRLRLGALAAEFARFFHTMDYRFHDEPRGAEQTAWLRAVERFAGSAPWRPPGDPSATAVMIDGGVRPAPRPAPGEDAGDAIGGERHEGATA